MEFREELKYSKSHEWVKEEGEEVVIGLTDYAQSELGDLVFVNLPEEGDEVTVGEPFAGVRRDQLDQRGASGHPGSHQRGAL